MLAFAQTYNYHYHCYYHYYPCPSHARAVIASSTNHTNAFVLMKQHWWFSGKIGRCHPKIF